MKKEEKTPEAPDYRWSTVSKQEQGKATLDRRKATLASGVLYLTAKILPTSEGMCARSSSMEHNSPSCGWK